MSDDWSDDGYRVIAAVLSARAGLAFRASQRDGIEDAIRRAMRRAGFASFDDYHARLHADAGLLDDLLVQTTVGETYFFRQPEQLKWLGDELLPEIVRNCRPARKARLWSAGCASGEEAYSLAMILHRQGLLSSASVLGTDVSRAALQRAQQALYRPWSLRGEGVRLARPYLSDEEGGHRVTPEIRAAVRFEYLNLATDNYPSVATGTRGLDLILCRNVMIYFDRDTVRSVVARFHRCLADGGWLITAASDPPLQDYGLFEMVSTNGGIFFRKAPAAPAPLPPERPSSALRPRAPASAAAAPSAAPPAPAGGPAAPPLGVSPQQRLSLARAALAAGQYQRAADLARLSLELDEACAVHVKALANQDVRQAEQACAAAAQRLPLRTELHYLHAVLLMDLGRHREACGALRRVLYLDRSLALAHFSLGAALRAAGDLEGARRALAQARQLLRAAPPESLLPLSEDERAGDLLEIAELQLESLDQTGGRG